MIRSVTGSNGRHFSGLCGTGLCELCSTALCVNCVTLASVALEEAVGVWQKLTKSATFVNRDWKVGSSS